MEKTTMITAGNGKKAYVAPDTIVMVIETASMIAFSDPTRNGNPYADPTPHTGSGTNRSRQHSFWDDEENY